MPGFALRVKISCRQCRKGSSAIPVRCGGWGTKDSQSVEGGNPVDSCVIFHNICFALSSTKERGDNRSGGGPERNGTCSKHIRRFERIMRFREGVSMAETGLAATLAVRKTSCSGGSRSRLIEDSFTESPRRLLSGVGSPYFFSRYFSVEVSKQFLEVSAKRTTFQGGLL